MSSYRYRDSHVKDKTVSPTVLSLTWESPYLGKIVFILKQGPGNGEFNSELSFISQQFSLHGYTLLIHICKQSRFTKALSICVWHWRQCHLRSFLSSAKLMWVSIYYNIYYADRMCVLSWLCISTKFDIDRATYQHPGLEIFVIDL